MKKNYLSLFVIILFFCFPYASFSSELPADEQPLYDDSREELELRLKNLETSYNVLINKIEGQEIGFQNALMGMNVLPDAGMSYSDWAVITLACVAVLVTALGVLMAILAVWGYKNIAKEAKTSAEIASNDASSRIAKLEVEKCINDIAKEELIKLIDSGELRKHLEDAVDLIYRNNTLTGGLRDGFGKYPELDEKEK